LQRNVNEMVKENSIRVLKWWGEGENTRQRQGNKERKRLKAERGLIGTECMCVGLDLWPLSVLAKMEYCCHSHKVTLNYWERERERVVGERQRRESVEGTRDCKRESAHGERDRLNERVLES
jgi:hypothetical protein